MLLKSQVKYIQSLGHKKFRDEEGVFTAEGPKIVNELLFTALIPAVDIFATTEWLKSIPELTNILPADHVHEMEPFQLEKISGLATPNQVIGVFRKPIFAEPLVKGRISLVLDNIQDPGNMGTIVRVADWFGIGNIFCSEHCADAFNPKAVQSSMASVARINIQTRELIPFLARHPSIPIFATTLDGENLFEIQPLKEGFIIIGNESQGIQTELLALSHRRITIPRIGRAESLNAAIATGIVLSRLTG
jgi:RNA methyltransferase, TrmH family